jgi:hypothetical protein
MRRVAELYLLDVETMDAQSLRELLIGGTALDLIHETSIQSFRFTDDGHVLATFGSKSHGPVTAFGITYFIAESGVLEFGKRGSDFHIVWEDIARDADIVSVRCSGHTLCFRFTPGKPKPKPYLP